MVKKERNKLDQSHRDVLFEQGIKYIEISKEWITKKVSWHGQKSSKACAIYITVSSMLTET